MVVDLPDYTKYITANINVPETETGPSYVAEYDSTPEDIEDGHKGPLLVDIKGRLYVIPYGEVQISSTQPVIPRPKGGQKTKGSVTTTDTYQTAATITVSSGETFQLSRIIVNASKAAWIKWRWDSADVGPEIVLDDITTLILHFPWNYHSMPGDGVKAFDIQAKWNTEAGTVNVEIVGEEVTT